jgi:DNA-binding IclR family transcriptional regulator
MTRSWNVLTNHARALVCIAHDPGIRLRDIAEALAITERRAFGIVTDLAQSGYVVKDKDGRRNRYRIQEHLPLPEAVAQERTIGELLRLLVDTTAAEAEQSAERTDRAADAAAVQSAPTGTSKSA